MPRETHSITLTSECSRSDWLEFTSANPVLEPSAHELAGLVRRVLAGCEADLKGGSESQRSGGGADFEQAMTLEFGESGLDDEGEETGGVEVLNVDSVL